MKHMSPANPFPTGLRTAVATLALLAAAGCAETPTRPVGSTVAAPIPPPATEVYAYPAQGQPASQLDRDRYECHLWAVKQSRFDPSLPGQAPLPPVRVVAGPPPGANVAAGAVTGAVIGAAVSSPHESGEGALVGAAAGALLGAVVDSANAEAARKAGQQQAQEQAAVAAQQEQQAAGYRRAITACLEGRGYTVQ